MNDAAATLLGIAIASGNPEPPAALPAKLQQRAAQGIVPHGQVLTWSDSTADADSALSSFNDLTGWECSTNFLHLEDYVPITINLVDGTPVLAEADQKTLLTHGFAFTMTFCQLVYALDSPTAVRCILAVNETNATFRFHQIRPGEQWNSPDLDDYHHEKLILVDIEPTPT